MKRSYWLFMFTFALVFYVLGAGYIESFVNYRTWHLIGAAEFKDYHNTLGPRIIAFLVVPVFSLVFLSFALIWVRPAAIPRWSAVVSFVLVAVIIVSTITLQIPIQRHFHYNGLSIPLLDKLILTDWLRKIPATLNAVLFMWMMTKVLRTARSEPPE